MLLIFINGAAWRKVNCGMKMLIEHWLPDKLQLQQNNKQGNILSPIVSVDLFWQISKEARPLKSL